MTRYLGEYPCEAPRCRNKARYVSGHCGVHDRLSSRVELPKRPKEGGRQGTIDVARIKASITAAIAASDAERRAAAALCVGSAIVLRNCSNGEELCGMIGNSLGHGSSADCYTFVTAQGVVVVKKYLHPYNMRRVTSEEVSMAQLRGGPGMLGFFGRFTCANGGQYLLVEHCARGSLRHAMLQAKTENRPLAPPAEYIVKSLLESLAFMHAQGIVHLDLKPSNIFLTSTGELRLGDLGLAARQGTELKGFRGTPKYAAPEITAQKETRSTWTADFSADVYSLGVVVQVMFGDAFGPWRACLATDPKDRPSAAELLAQMQ